MESTKRKRNGVQSGDNGAGAHHPSKCPRGLKPDITVVVGKGKSKKSFECYSVVLRLASDVFDAMLGTDMKERNSGEICLPDKKPQEWEMFYQFLHPASTAELNLENIDVMLPWFHEFRMTEWLLKCDVILSKNWLLRTVSEVEDGLDEVFLALQNAELYQLKTTENTLVYEIEDRLHRSDYLSESFINQLKPFLHREFAAEYWWEPLKRYLPEEMQSDDPGNLLKNEIFPILLISRMQLLELEREAEKKARADVESEHEDDIRQLCAQLYDAMPNRKTAPMKVNLFVRRELEKILRRRGMEF